MRIFLITFILSGFFIHAQSYSYWITDYRNGVQSAMLGVPGDQFKSAITFSNSSSGIVYVFVKRTQKSIPLYWSQWYHYLQPGSPSQDTITLKLSPSSASVLNVHFKTDSVNPGVATASFKMYQIGYPDDSDVCNMTASTMKQPDVGLRTELLTGDIRIFPNPALHLLNIATEKHKTGITIYDALGVERYKTENKALEHSVDLSGYPAGIYFVKVADEGTAYLRKIVKH